MTCKHYPKPYKTRGKAVTPIPILPLFQKELTGQKNPENGEEQRQFVRRKSRIDMTEIEEVRKIIGKAELTQRRYIAMLEILDKTEKHNHEKQSDTENASCHRL